MHNKENSHLSESYQCPLVVELLTKHDLRISSDKIAEPQLNVVISIVHRIK